MKPKQVCQFCEKKFKRVKGHYAFCKVRNAPPERPTPTYQDVVNTKLEGARANADSQVMRNKEVMMELASSITRLNNAFATIVAEWRF